MSLFRTSALVAGIVASCAGMAFGAFTEPCERGPFPLAIPDARVCRDVANFNGDDFVDFFDYDDFMACWNAEPGCTGDADINCDTGMDFFDHDMFYYAWTTSSPLPACNTSQMTFHWTVVTATSCSRDGYMNDDPAGWGSDYNNLRRDTLCLLENDLVYSMPGQSGFNVAPHRYYMGVSAGSGSCETTHLNVGLHTMFYNPGTTDFAPDWAQEFEDRLDMWTGFFGTTIGTFFPASPGPCDADSNRPGSQIELGIVDIETLPLRYHHFHSTVLTCPNPSNTCPMVTVNGLELFHKDNTRCAQRTLWSRLVEDYMLATPATVPNQDRVTALLADMISEGFWSNSDPSTICDLRDPINEDALTKFTVNSYNYYIWRFVAATMDTAREESGCGTKWGFYAIPWRVNSTQVPFSGDLYGDGPDEDKWDEAWTYAVQDRKLFEAVDFFAPPLYPEFTDKPGTYITNYGGWLDSDSLDEWLVANFGNQNELNVTVTDRTEWDNNPTTQLCTGYYNAIQELHGIYRPIYPFYTWRAKHQQHGTCSPRAPITMNHDEARRTLASMWHMGVDGVLIWGHFYDEFYFPCSTNRIDDGATIKDAFMDPVILELIKNDFELAPLCDYPLIAHDTCEE